MISRNEIDLMNTFGGDGSECYIVLGLMHYDLACDIDTGLI